MIISAYPGALGTLFPAWGLDSIQALGFDTSGRRLACDGKEGPLTRSGRYLIPDGSEPALVREMLAFVQEGVRETGPENNSGPMIARLRGLPENTPGNLGAWCAVTVSRALLNGRLVAGYEMIRGARRVTDWFDAKGRRVRDLADIRAGDIVSWAVPREGVPYGGHVGVVCHVDGDDVYVIEGNGSAPRGRVRVYRYSLAAGLVYGTHPVWKVVRPV